MHKKPSFSKKLLFLGILIPAFSCLILFLFSFRQDEKRFTNLTSRLFTSEMKANTLNMHYSLAVPSDFGIYQYRAILPAYQAQGALGEQAATENTLSALRSIHSSALTEADAYLCTLLTRTLESSLALSSFPYYSEPLSPSSGMQSQLPILLAEYTFRCKRDVEDYLSLLEQTDEYFASLLLYEKEKAAAGLLMPASSLQNVRQQCDTIVTKEALENGSHFLQTTFAERLERLSLKGLITTEEASGYLSQNDRLLKTVLLPAYVALGDGLLLLEDTSIPLAGLASKPQGKAYYEALLISETGSYRPVPEVQELLTTRFALEYDAIREIATDYPEVVQTDFCEGSDFPLTTPEQMLADLQGRMKELFPAIPGNATDISVKAVSESLQDYCAPAFYLTAPLDDTESNVIYINSKKTSEGLELYTTLAHEGYPGHLYQTVYSNRRALEKNVRPVRELLWYGGYLEGWALYVEFLSFDYASEILREAGAPQDAILVQIEKHNRSLQLCLYSLLDIMIHYEGATYSQVAKMLEGFGITDSASIKAVYAYIVREPCNYMKYYLGYLEILALQEEARTLWGGSYSDYRFHSFLLDNGPADFQSLKEQLEHTLPCSPLATALPSYSPDILCPRAESLIS